MISIDKLIPLIEYGYVTMDINNKWMWWPTKPTLDKKEGRWYIKNPNPADRYPTGLNTLFNIKPVEDYTQSLRKCGGAI